MLGLVSWQFRACGGENRLAPNCWHGIDTGFSKKVPDRSNFEKGLGLGLGLGLARLTWTE